MLFSFFCFNPKYLSWYTLLASFILLILCTRRWWNGLSDCRKRRLPLLRRSESSGSRYATRLLCESLANAYTSTPRNAHTIQKRITYTCAHAIAIGDCFSFTDVLASAQCIQRTALVLLKPVLAPWRYQRGMII